MAARSKAIQKKTNKRKERKKQGITNWKANNSL